MGKAWTVLALGASVACGGTAATKDPCQVTLSGALSGKYLCTAVIYDPTGPIRQPVIRYDVINNRSSVSLAAGEPIRASISFPGMPRNGAFESTASGAQGAIEVQVAMVTEYAASVAIDGVVDQGTYRLVVTEFAGETPEASNKYVLQGSLDATLPAVPGTGSSGQLTLHAIF